MSIKSEENQWRRRRPISIRSGIAIFSLQTKYSCSPVLGEESSKELKKTAFNRHQAKKFVNLLKNLRKNTKESDATLAELRGISSGDFWHVSLPRIDLLPIGPWHFGPARGRSGQFFRRDRRKQLSWFVITTFFQYHSRTFDLFDWNVRCVYLELNSFRLRFGKLAIRFKSK